MAFFRHIDPMDIAPTEAYLVPDHKIAYRRERLVDLKYLTQKHIISLNHRGNLKQNLFAPENDGEMRTTSYRIGERVN
jgi:hypothetical protein